MSNNDLSGNDHITGFLVNEHSIDSFSAISKNNLSTAYGQNITSNYENNASHTSAGQYYQHVADEQNDSTSVHMKNISVPKISMTFDSSQSQILKVEFAEVEIEIAIKQKSPSISNQQNHSSTYSSTSRTENRTHPYRKPTEQNFRKNNRNDTYSSYSSAPVIMTPMTPQLNAMYMQNDQSVITTDNPQPLQQNEELIESFSSSYDNFHG